MTTAKLDLRPALDEALDWRFRMIPQHRGEITVGNIGDQGWSLRGGQLLFPAMVLRESALTHNLDVMARYCREHDVELAPHGKTAMAPQLLERQLDAGAWGVTVANVSQGRVFRRFGAGRILIANEVVDPGAVAWIAKEMRADHRLQVVCLVDSVAGVDLLDAAMNTDGDGPRLAVLVELGHDGGRTGCRTETAAVEVAAAVARASGLVLTGVEGYEGGIGHDRSETTVAAVRAFLMRVRSLAERLATEGAFDEAGEILLTAGGSAWFDQVAACLRPGWEESPIPVRVIIRSGCYATHDCGFYEQVSPLQGSLRPALEVWGRVLSRPEPGLAICGFGRRDVPYDIALPTPLRVVRGGTDTEAAGDALQVTAVNDQHAFVRVDPDYRLGPGDLLVCGITHPCTAFDKWPLVLTADDDDRVIGAFRTYF